MSDSVQPHRWQPIRLHRPWDSPGKNTGVGVPFPSPVHESEKSKWRHSVVSDSSWPHGLQPTRLLCPWDFPGKSTAVGCHCLLQLAAWETNKLGVEQLGQGIMELNLASVPQFSHSVVSDFVPLGYAFALSLCKCESHSVVSHSLWPRGLQPARILCPWNSPGKDIGEGGHFRLHDDLIFIFFQSLTLLYPHVFSLPFWCFTNILSPTLQFWRWLFVSSRMFFTYKNEKKIAFHILTSWSCLT